jgi:chemotaxis protein histidine kinase CheA/CheY-like chemotaxis protein
MRLDDLLRVMREEFAQAADDIDSRLLAWCSEGAAGAPHCAGAIAQELDRIAQTARIISLQGLGDALEQVRDHTQALACFDEDNMGVGLSWLMGWRAPFEASFAAPGQADSAQAVLAFLAQSPLYAGASPQDLATDPQLQNLRLLLVAPAQMPQAAIEEGLALPDATDDDVSLDVPADIDRDLFDTFLADAPGQVARLAQAVALLVRGQLPPAQVQEAQRVAHTFKGSGNIIGVRGVGRLAHRIEDLIEFAAELAVQHPGPLPAPLAHDLEQATATLDQMLFALRGEEAPPTDARQRLQALLDWVNAIRADTWQALAQARSAAVVTIAAMPAVHMPTVEAVAVETAVPAVLAAPTVAPTAAPAVVPTPPRRAATPAPAPAAAAEAQVQLRVDVSQLDRLVRRAGQDLVRGGRLAEHLHAIDERLTALDNTHRALHKRLAELQVALERQGVSLNEKSVTAAAQGGGFDPLEMDRYNHLHALSRFVAEGVADSAEVASAARLETTLAVAAAREHGVSLKDQHHGLIATRMVPFQRAVARLRRTVTQTAGLLGRQVRLDVTGDHVQLDSDVLERLTEPLLHLLRNAVDHGIEPPHERLAAGKAAEGCIRLLIKRDGHTVQVQCHDDGRGINLQAVRSKAEQLGLLSAADAASGVLDAAAVARLILLPGFSTRSEVTETSGRGVGLDVVAERVRAMKGHVDIQTANLLTLGTSSGATHEAGTTITLRVPATTGTVHALVVEAGGSLFALATDSVVAAVAPGDGSLGQGVDAGHFTHNNQRYAHARLAQWVGLNIGLNMGLDSQQDEAMHTADDDLRPTVLVRGAGRTVALAVDRVVDTRELVLQDTGLLLRRARGVAGGAFRSNGQVLFVLDPDALDAASSRPVAAHAAARLRQVAQAKRQRVLVVDDAISVRKALVQLLQDAGFEAVGARDGFDALGCVDSSQNNAQKQGFDLVVTDLEMPNLNGLDFTRLLRQNPAYGKVPVVMITSRSTQKHREAAELAGVSLYLTKPYTDEALLAQVRGLLAA